MEKIKCPGCSSPMDIINDPDISYEKCPNCGGLFLDAGELNSLVTTKAGDVEYLFYDDGFLADELPEELPVRRCPKCHDREMSMVGLQGYSETVIDRCGSCGSIFLDDGELEETERKLLMSLGAPEETRGYIDGYFVRRDRLSTLNIYSSPAGPGGSSSPSSHTNTMLRVSVGLNHPISSTLHLFSGTMKDRFFKFINLFKGENIVIGDKEFDSTFILQGDDPEIIRAIFGKDEIKKALIEFATNPPKIFTKKGKIEVVGNRLVYTEGNYAVGNKSIDYENASTETVEKMIEIAKMIDEASIEI